MEAVAKLRNYPTSPMKMRLLADAIRGKKIDWSIHYLLHHPMPGAVALKKLLLSAISNWKIKNAQPDEENLYIKIIYVDGGAVLKRMLPAPQGRAHRKKKRSNHITLFIDKYENVSKVVSTKDEAPVAVKKTRAKKTTITDNQTIQTQN